MNQTQFKSPDPELDLAKYRPVLTAREVMHLGICLHNILVHSSGIIPNGNQELHNQLLKKFQVLHAKINLQAINPAYREKDWITELGLSEAVSPEERRRSIYNRFKENPASLSADEIPILQTYLYENNLMEAKQREEYELKLWEGKL